MMMPRRQKTFNDPPFDSFVLIFGFVWGKMQAEHFLGVCDFLVFIGFLNSHLFFLLGSCVEVHLLALPTYATILCIDTSIFLYENFRKMIFWLVLKLEL
jgi:hypothetical protein